MSFDALLASAHSREEEETVAEDLTISNGAVPDELEQVGAVSVLVCSPEGPLVRVEQNALDIIGTAMYLRAAWAAVPVTRLTPEFFELRSGLAGQILQKFVNYQVGLAVVGDISAFTAASGALRDLVRESNQGVHHWFVPDLDAARSRLAPPDRNGS
ncbi:DUF4180 domain-containing protein [Parafrankia sp. BMG5.11]|uniref:DUF4180 domain-containing protein n=1 Tax=Parafrankia sp. BMG5.11 TaxID=222540 RepID=UPI000DA47D00|nr:MULTISPECIES: DUF4180 domain-containing protein [unclassified Parafrankia]SQD95554.1 Alpha/beta hydrolase [Parafrankia sp. Ea1.12]